jgi:hypothetical protein
MGHSLAWTPNQRQKCNNAVITQNFTNVLLHTSLYVAKLEICKFALHLS